MSGGVGVDDEVIDAFHEVKKGALCYALFKIDYPDNWDWKVIYFYC